MAELKITAANFENEVLHSDKPVLLDFYADWCGPCKSFAPVFEQAAGQLAGKCRLAKLDSEANQQLSAQLGIRSIPSLILFKNGQEVARLVRPLDSAEIARAFALIEA